MNIPLTRDIEAWEDEGGAAPGLIGVLAPALTGTPNQVEWADRIRLRVNAEFDRVARALELTPAYSRPLRDPG